MDTNNNEHLRIRTDAKLRYAEIHLEELRAIEPLGGDDFDRAHQESFLFHLLGAKEAFLLELNSYYGINLNVGDITVGKLRESLKKQGKVSPELAEIFELESDKNSWLFHAKKMRDHSTHVWWIRRDYHLGGANHEQVWLDNPKTGQQIKRHFVDEFKDWILNMKDLLNRLRINASLDKKET